ncbi:ArgE/DapE family deacylase [uncultured Amnibacterium sp.]|uniref:ArgE/DapE family deacylase n=1 Tax=uncultured Amnibacterium sp. TaxID=1631851 RepID=UPI0035C97696
MHPVTPLEERVLGLLDPAALVQDLVDLVRIPSITASAAESDLQHRQADQLRAAGFEVDLWSFDLGALAADPEHPGTEAERSEGYGVVGVLGGDGRPGLALQGHVDVVPTGDPARWVDGGPFEGRIADGAVHGRGACDMKAGVAVNTAVARTIAAAGVILERPLAVHSVISEEDGGLGAFATMRRGHRADAAVLTEPTSGRVVTANAGSLTFRLRIAGRAAHGSTRLEGVSALDAYLPVHRALQELERERNADPAPLFRDTTLPYPISVGRIRAGDWASSVPDLLVAEGRMGVRLGEDPAETRAALEHAIDEACALDPWLRDHPVRLDWPGGRFASGMLPSGDPLLDEVRAAVVAVGGASPEESAAPYGSDLRLYAGLGGIPTLHYGPGDVRFAHAPREQVRIDEVVRVAEALLVLALRRCGARA